MTINSWLGYSFIEIPKLPTFNDNLIFNIYASDGLMLEYYMYTFTAASAKIENKFLFHMYITGSTAPIS